MNHIFNHNGIKLETRKKMGKKHKHVETKQHAIKQSMGHQTNKRETFFFKYLETKENVNTMVQNLWDTAKTVLRGKVIAICKNKKNLK